jgi:hypothetical protein
MLLPLYKTPSGSVTFISLSLSISLSLKKPLLQRDLYVGGAKEGVMLRTKHIGFFLTKVS